MRRMRKARNTQRAIERQVKQWEAMLERRWDDIPLSRDTRARLLDDQPVERIERRLIRPDAEPPSSLSVFRAYAKDDGLYVRAPEGEVRITELYSVDGAGVPVVSYEVGDAMPIQSVPIGATLTAVQVKQLSDVLQGVPTPTIPIRYVLFNVYEQRVVLPETIALRLISTRADKPLDPGMYSSVLATGVDFRGAEAVIQAAITSATQVEGVPLQVEVVWSPPPSEGVVFPVNAFGTTIELPLEAMTERMLREYVPVADTDWLSTIGQMLRDDQYRQTLNPQIAEMARTLVEEEVRKRSQQTAVQIPNVQALAVEAFERAFLRHLQEVLGRMYETAAPDVKKVGKDTLRQTGKWPLLASSVEQRYILLAVFKVLVDRQVCSRERAIDILNKATPYAAYIDIIKQQGFVDAVFLGHTDTLFMAPLTEDVLDHYLDLYEKNKPVAGNPADMGDIKEMVRAIPTLVQEIVRLQDLFAVVFAVYPCHVAAHAKLHQSGRMCNMQASANLYELLEILGVSATDVPRRLHSEPCVCRTDGDWRIWQRSGRWPGSPGQDEVTDTWKGDPAMAEANAANTANAQDASISRSLMAAYEAGMNAREAEGAKKAQQFMEQSARDQVREVREDQERQYEILRKISSVLAPDSEGDNDG